MPQKPYKPPYAHLFQTIYVCRQDLSNNQTSLKKTESAVLISLPLFFHIFDQKQHNFDQFFQKIWKKIFCPKHSVFDGKLNGESIFFGPMVLKNLLFQKMDFFIRMAKWADFETTPKWPKSNINFFLKFWKKISAGTQWFSLQIEWGIHFFWSRGSKMSGSFRIWTFLYLSPLLFHFFWPKQP